MIPPDYTIKISTFKPSGKWYNSNFSDFAQSYIQLSEEHRKLHGYELMDILKANGPDVKQYSTLASGIDGQMFHTIEVFYPTEVRKFCNFHMDITERE